jgi:hypothetical protein
MKPRAANVDCRPNMAIGVLPRRPALQLAGLLALLLLPIWLFPVFPSQDGPSHVANASLLLDLLRGGPGAAHGLYELNLEPFPNWFTHAGLAALLTVLSPVVAEKAFLSAFVVLFALAFRNALRALDERAGALAPLCLPLVYDRSLHLGYYNRSFALVPLLLALGLWMRSRGRLSPLSVVALAALLLWAYFCTAIGLLLAVLALGVLAVAVAVAEPDGAQGTRWHRLTSRSVMLAVASAPALLLTWRFGAQQGAGVEVAGEPVESRLRALAALEWLVALDPRERWLSGTLAVLLGLWLVLAVLARRRQGCWQWHDGLLAAAAAASIGYLAVPPVAIVGHGPWGAPVHDRVAPHIPLLLLLWLAVQPVAPRWRQLLVTGIVVIGVGLIALRLPRYSELNEHLAEYLSASAALPGGAAVLPLSFAHQGRGDDGQPLAAATWPFRHAADWLVVSRGVLNLDNYEAEVSFFPVAWRRGQDPYRLLGSSLDRLPGCVHLGRFNRNAPRPAEFLVVWGSRGADWYDDPCGAELLRTINSQYRRVFVSEPRGQMEVYRRIGGGPQP